VDTSDVERVSIFKPVDIAQTSFQARLVDAVCVAAPIARIFEEMSHAAHRDTNHHRTWSRMPACHGTHISGLERLNKLEGAVMLLEDVLADATRRPLMTVCRSCGSILLKCNKCGHVGCKSTDTHNFPVGIAIPTLCPNSFGGPRGGPTCGLCGSMDHEDL
jgi:hypothetical protein